MKVYFDNAATTKIRKEVAKAMYDSMENIYGNPNSTHAFGRESKNEIELARKSIASLLNANPQEIIFTSGGTESNNFALTAAVKDLGVKTIFTTKIEHHAVGHVVKELATQDINVQYVPIDNKGQIIWDKFEELLANNSTKKLVSLMTVNNEVGNLLDIEKTSKLCQKYDALFHTDAVQAIGHFEIDTKNTSIDFLSASAHKFHGPKGIGFIYIKKSNKVNPCMIGGGQEFGLRGGTQAVNNIIGMKVALEYAYKELNEEKKYIIELKKYFIKKIKELLPKCVFNGMSGDIDKSTYTLVNVSLPVKEDIANLLGFHLDLNGIACSKGSACQSGSASGSHVLSALGVDTSKIPAVRFSFSIHNTKKEIDYLMEVLEKINS